MSFTEPSTGNNRTGDARPWTSSEIALLREHADQGAQAVAAILGRGVAAVKKQAHRHRISLRRKGEKRGTLFGQPRGTSWADLRAAGLSDAAIEDLRNGRIDVATVEQQIAALAAGEPVALCPICSRWPQLPRLGVCRPCQIKALAEAHRERAAIDAAQRELWTARQQKKREGRTQPRRSEQHPLDLDGA